jgi:hypothetical protein
MKELVYEGKSETREELWRIVDASTRIRNSSQECETGCKAGWDSVDSEGHLQLQLVEITDVIK